MEGSDMSIAEEIERRRNDESFLQMRREYSSEWARDRGNPVPPEERQG
jgi:hypothetical protein